MLYNAKTAVQKMHVVGELTGKCLDELTAFIKPGITTKDIEAFVINFQNAYDLQNAQFGYRKFPGYCCTSVNHEICHGIPSNKKLRDGHIVKVDVTFIKDGYHGDACRTYFVGKDINPKIVKLVDATYEAMLLGIEAARPGNRIGDIGKAIENFINEQGFSVIKDFVGHGIGKEFHEFPAIPHYFTEDIKDVNIEITPGMFFTIEPMIAAGKADYKILNDGWTVVTRDRSWVAQFEHTIAITETGNAILTDCYY